MKRIISVDKLKGILIVPITLTIILIATSVLTGWNLLTLIVFWFALIPCLAIYLPKKISKRKNLLPESLTGMVIFYAVIIFLIYDYNNTDYFKALLISCAINLVLIPLLSFTTRREEHTA